ncbi:MAG: laccase domain-containing protein [Ignavibacteria bacterium]|nr:laccase domain-containing protein [Ignavibacteria bacterium]
MQLISAGVKKENIEVSGLCTFKEKDLLHSYRRDRDRSGRMFGVIGIRL